VQTPHVTEIRRAGHPLEEAHRRQVELVARSLTAVPDRRRGTWDEATRSERPPRAA
jgi:hypothetical protein